MKKQEILDRWDNLRIRSIQARPIPYKHKGSTFNQDGIRITGSQKFIDSVLSRLTDMLDYENGDTRLNVAYKQATDKETGKLIDDAWTCYVQVHQRG